MNKEQFRTVKKIIQGRGKTDMQVVSGQAFSPDAPRRPVYLSHKSDILIAKSGTRRPLFGLKHIIVDRVSQIAPDVAVVKSYNAGYAVDEERALYWVAQKIKAEDQRYARKTKKVQEQMQRKSPLPFRIKF